MGDFLASGLWNQDVLLYGATDKDIKKLYTSAHRLHILLQLLYELGNSINYFPQI